MEAAATEASGPLDATPNVTGAGDPEKKKTEAKEAAIYADQKAKVKAKIYDKEEEVSVEDLVKHYQKERAADLKFQKAAEIERKAKESEKKLADYQKKLKENFWEVAQESGYDPDEIAEQRLLKKLEFEMMNEDQKRSYKLQKELDEEKARTKFYAEQEAKQKEELAKAETEKLKLSQIQEIDTTLTEVLKEKGLKPNPAILENVAQYMLAHLTSEKGNKDITAKEALEYVLAQSEKDFLSRIEATKVEDLLTKLPKTYVDAIRKYFVDQVTSGTVKPQKVTPTTQAAKKPTKISTDDFFDKLEQKFA